MAAHHRDVVMIPLRVSAVALGSMMEGLTAAGCLRGLVVTLPHKEAILSYCTQLTAVARRVGAANVVRFSGPDGEVIGTNTDGEGLVAGLRSKGIDPRGQQVYLAGAGGAAKAIASALLDAGVDCLGIFNRTTDRARELVEKLRSEYPMARVVLDSDEPSQYTLAINATSLGLQANDPLPFSVDRLAVDCVVAGINEYRQPRYAPNAPEPDPAPPGGTTESFPIAGTYFDNGTALRTGGLSLAYFLTQRWGLALEYSRPLSGKSGQLLVPFRQRQCPAGSLPGAATCDESDQGEVLLDGQGSARSFSSDSLRFSMSYNFGHADIYPCQGCVQ